MKGLNPDLHPLEASKCPGTVLLEADIQLVQAWLVSIELLPHLIDMEQYLIEALLNLIEASIHLGSMGLLSGGRLLQSRDIH
jgi:hypothetical protein